ncbi:MAG TPA: ABC transporter permease [Bacteroidales bacterium]|nr:ABC transporter permease [Bacteroidales bacterium]
MRTILYLIRKEFIQIFRNKFLSKAIFGIPIVQIVILVPAVTFEIKNIELCIVDMDMSAESRQLISKLQGSDFFLLKHTTFDEKEADDMLHADKCDMILHIPENFGRNVVREEKEKLMVVANAINATSAQLAWAYMRGILQDYNSELKVRSMQSNTPGRLSLIETTNRFWYNPSLNYKYYMLPGILVILVTAIGLLLAGLNVVREKEIGTIEQLNVTPIRKYQFITAKLVPFLVIGLVDLAFGLVLGKILFNIPFNGSIAMLFLFAAFYLIAVLGLALFLSTLSSTQQQYLFVVFFVLMIFVLMSGIFTPEESMPLWARRFNIINPTAYFMRVIRMVMLKGSGFADVFQDVRGIIIIGIATISLAIWRYRKTV